MGEDVILDYDEEMSVTVDDLSTLNSEVIEERRILKAYKQADSGYYTFKIKKGEDLVKIENAIAKAYSESSPVVLLVGASPR